MTLNEYRAELLERLRRCHDAQAARDLLSEVDLFLRNSQVKPVTQDKFWEALEEDLVALAQEAKRVPDPVSSAVLAAVIGAAKARVFRYRARNDSGDA